MPKEDHSDKYLYNPGEIDKAPKANKGDKVKWMN